MNKFYISKIIEETLSGLPYQFKTSMADHMMVAITFLAETGMYTKPVTSARTRGMMLMAESDIESVVHDIIMPDDKMYEYVLNYTMVDCREFDDVDIFLAADYNIAFQIILTYLYLFHANGEKPSSIQEATNFYQEKWNGVNLNKNTSHLSRLIGEYSTGA